MAGSYHPSLRVLLKPVEVGRLASLVALSSSTASLAIPIETLTRAPSDQRALTGGAMRANVRSITMTSQGHAYTQFQRALRAGNAFLALETARELHRLTLEDALSLCLVLRTDTRRYQRATARWLARYQAEVEAVTLTDIREVADLLAALPVFGAEPAGELAEWFEQHGLYLCASRVRDVLTE